MYADKNRTIPVLRSMGLHRPMARLQYGCLNNLSYRKDHINLWGVPLDGVIEFKDDADTYGRHKYSAGETDDDYKDAVFELVSFMKEHDLYVPDDFQSARGAAEIPEKRTCRGFEPRAKQAADAPGFAADPLRSKALRAWGVRGSRIPQNKRKRLSTKGTAAAPST